MIKVISQLCFVCFLENSNKKLLSFQLKQVSFDFHDSEQNGIEHLSLPTLIIFQKLV